MNKLALGAFALALAMSSCGGQDSDKMTPEESQKIEAAIEKIETESTEIENLKMEMDETAKELDAAIDDL